jgi:hypothetical protein
VHLPVVFHILVQQPNLGTCGERCFFFLSFPKEVFLFFYVGTECCHSISVSVEFPLFSLYCVVYLRDLLLDFTACFTCLFFCLFLSSGQEPDHKLRQ